MRSLFLKIFLTFWLAMVLVSGTLIASVVTTQSQFKAMRAEEFDRTVMPLMAARAADILDDHGMGALSDFLSSLQTSLGWQAYLFDDGGRRRHGASCAGNKRNKNPDIPRHTIRRDAHDRRNRHALCAGDRYACGIRCGCVARSDPSSDRSRGGRIFHRGVRMLLAGALYHCSDRASSRGRAPGRDRGLERAGRRRRWKSRR